MPPQMVRIDPGAIDGRRLEGIWPRRLLHAKTMRSFEGTGPMGNMYNGIEAPEYNVLSYTWGRWRKPHGPRLPVKGIAWTVPSIQASAFTVEEFSNAIIQASDNVEFVWVDIACIDQEDSTIMALEIGRQAGIFFGAKDYFMWLHDLSTKELETSIKTILKCLDELRSGEAQVDQPSSRRRHAWVRQINHALTVLLSDNWFSSLWTLQEAQLGAIGKLMARTGPVLGTLGSTRTMTVYRLSTTLTTIHSRLSEHGAPGSEVPYTAQDELRDVCTLIEKTGLRVQLLAVPLYTAASMRTTLYPLDRIYGIMQVFNFCLGKSARPNEDFSLSELEVQFALELAKSSPIMAQLFSHVKPAGLGQAWCVKQSCIFPANGLKDLFTGSMASSSCTIALDHNYLPCFTGSAYPIQHMFRLWDAVKHQALSLEYARSPTCIWDAGRLANGDAIDSFRHDIRDRSCSRSVGYEVLILGLLPEYSAHEQTRGMLDSNFMDEVKTVVVGLVVEQLPLGHESGWRRIGIVLWPYVSQTFFEMWVGRQKAVKRLLM